MKYYGEFTDINDKLYQVSIITNGDSSNTTPIVLGDSPVIIEYLNEDTIYEPTKYSRATIKLITKDYMPDLYSGSAQGVKVEITGAFNWYGYLTPNIYTQSYEASIEELELEAIDGLSTLQYIEYSPRSGVKDIIKFNDLIEYLLGKADCYRGFYYVNSIVNTNYNSSIIYESFISEQNFFDEDDKPMTCQEVFEQVCRYLNITAYAVGGIVYFVDYDDIKNSEASIYHTDSLTNNITFTYNIQNRSIIDKYQQNGTTITLDTVFNKVILKDNLYSFDSIIPSIWDDKYLTNYGGEWNYNNELQLVEEDGKGGKHLCLFKYYWNDNYKSYYYHQGSLSPAVGISTIDYGATQEFVGATICRAYFKKVDSFDDIINSVKYTDYLLLHNHDQNNTEAGRIDSINPLYNNYEITLESDEGLPLFELEVNNANPAFIGGENTHLIIQGSYLYMDRESEMYIMEGYSNKDDNFHSKNLWIKAKLQYGNKYWDGEQWTTTDTCFKLPFYDNGSTDHCINKEFPTKNTVNWDMGIDEDGYLIPLPENTVLDYKPTFTLYQPHRLDNDYRCDAVWLKNFDIKAVIAHPNKDMDMIDDSDTEYSNVINGNFVEKLELDDFKICTWDNKKPNYSAVCFSNNSNYSFLDKVNHRSLQVFLRPEELLIYKLVNQYSTPSIKLQVTTDIQTLDKGLNCYECSLIENVKFIADSFILDLRYDKAEITLVEKK